MNYRTLLLLGAICFATLPLFSQLEVSLPPNITICPGETITIGPPIVSGGNQQYSYWWTPTDELDDPSNPTQQFMPWMPMTLTVQVTDTDGLTGEASIDIFFIPAPVFETTVVNNQCAQDANGSISIEVTSGDGPYHFQWSNGQSGEGLSSIDNLQSGQYFVSITDANGCITPQVTLVETISDLQINAIATPLTCSDTEDGAITLQPAGGSGSYTFDWDHLPGNDDPQNLTGLSTGFYCVTVTDGVGCNQDICLAVSAPASINVTGLVTGSCGGANTGEIELTVSGGHSLFMNISGRMGLNKRIYQGLYRESILSRW
ncbi:MAG: SprB repeat-containing protein [Saprospiraceae bacterium]